MGEPKSTEPSMEEILASIKRIIADDGAVATASPRARTRPVAVPPSDPELSTDDDAVLELTDAMPLADPTPPPRKSRAASQPARGDIVADTPELVSDDAALASREALHALSKLVVRPEAGADNTLDGLVREMLRPMLKEWLDSRLPELVEGLVAREIARITGRSL